MNNKVITMLIPVIAVMIIIESIVLVSNLEKSNTATVTEEKETSNVVLNEEKKKNSFSVNFSTDETQMKVGKKYKILVKLTPQSDYNLDALDLYVKFDPELVSVSNLVSSDSLSNPVLMKVSDKKNVIAMNYLFSEEEGFPFLKDKETVLLTFTLTPKIPGLTSLEISTGDSEGDSVTMFVDKNTGDKLLFTSEKLEIESIK